MTTLNIVGTSNPLAIGESRHYILRWVLQNVPTSDREASLLRLRYYFKDPAGKILYQRSLQLLPEVDQWDVVVEIPRDYHDRSLLFVAESEQGGQISSTSHEINVKS